MAGEPGICHDFSQRVASVALGVMIVWLKIRFKGWPSGPLN